MKIVRPDKTRGGARYSGVGLFCLDSLLLSHQGERRSNITDETVTFELIDLLGKVQFSIRLSVANIHQLNLQQMQSGLCIYRLIVNDKITESDKLIIQ